MINRKNVLLLFLVMIFLIFTYSLSSAIDIGIVWDVSGSMENENLSAAKKWVKSLLVENKIITDNEWIRISPDEKSSELDGLLTQKKLLNQDDLVMYLPFGVLKSKIFPYFSKPVSHSYINSKGLEQFLNENLSTSASESQTYKTLPEWELSEQFKRQARNMWYLIIVSDFNRDQMINLSPEQEKKVVEWENNKGEFRQEPLLDMSYKQLYRVKIKKVSTNRIEPPKNVKSEIVIISPGFDQKLKITKGQKLTFSWDWRGSVKPESYAVSVMNGDKKGKSIFSNIAYDTTYTHNKKIKSGSYKYQITAYLPDGRSVSSEWVPFELSGGSVGWIHIILFILGIVLIIFAIRFIKPLIKKRKEGV